MIDPMNTRMLLLFSGWIALAATGYAQESIHLAGDDVQTITPQIIETVQSLTQLVSLPGKDTRVWMLRRCKMTGHVLIEALLWPQVANSRLIRGEKVLCNNIPESNPGFPPAPVVNGWTLTNPEPSHYAFVAPPDQPFNPNDPFPKPFEVDGLVSDADVVAVADAVRQFGSRYLISYVRGSGATNSAIAVCVSTDGEPDARRRPSVELILKRDGAKWIVTKSEDEEPTVVPLSCSAHWSNTLYTAEGSLLSNHMV